MWNKCLRNLRRNSSSLPVYSVFHLNLIQNVSSRSLVNTYVVWFHLFQTHKSLLKQYVCGCLYVYNATAKNDAKCGCSILRSSKLMTPIKAYVLYVFVPYNICKNIVSYRLPVSKLISRTNVFQSVVNKETKIYYENLIQLNTTYQHQKSHLISKI